MRLDPAQPRRAAVVERRGADDVAGEEHSRRRCPELRRQGPRDRVLQRRRRDRLVRRRREPVAVPDVEGVGPAAVGDARPAGGQLGKERRRSGAVGDVEQLRAGRVLELPGARVVEHRRVDALVAVLDEPGEAANAGRRRGGRRRSCGGPHLGGAPDAHCDDGRRRLAEREGGHRARRDIQDRRRALPGAHVHLAGGVGHAARCAPDREAALGDAVLSYLPERPVEADAGPDAAAADGDAADRRRQVGDGPDGRVRARVDPDDRSVPTSEPERAVAVGDRRRNRDPDARQHPSRARVEAEQLVGIDPDPDAPVADCDRPGGRSRAARKADAAQPVIARIDPDDLGAGRLAGPDGPGADRDPCRGRPEGDERGDRLAGARVDRRQRAVDDVGDPHLGPPGERPGGGEAGSRADRDLAEHRLRAGPEEDGHGPADACRRTSIDAGHQRGHAERQQGDRHDRDRGQTPDAARSDGGRPVTLGRRRRIERGVLVEDRTLQPPQGRSRRHAEPLVEDAARTLVRLERLGLPTSAVQGQHLLPVGPLPQRVIGHQALDLRQQRDVLAELQPGLDPLLQDVGAERVETGDLGCRPALERDVGQRRPPPQRERLVGERQRLGGVPRCPPLTGRAQELLEAMGVDLLRCDREPVAAALRDQDLAGARARLERLAQAGHVDLQHRGHGVGWPIAPQLVDQPIRAERSRRVQQEEQEQRALAPGDDRLEPSVAANLERSEQREVDRRQATPSHRATLTHAARCSTFSAPALRI